MTLPAWMTKEGGEPPMPGAPHALGGLNGGPIPQNREIRRIFVPVLYIVLCALSGFVLSNPRSCACAGVVARRTVLSVVSCRARGSLCGYAGQLFMRFRLSFAFIPPVLESTACRVLKSFGFTITNQEMQTEKAINK